MSILIHLNVVKAYGYLIEHDLSFAVSLLFISLYFVVLLVLSSFLLFSALVIVIPKITQTSSFPGRVFISSLY